MPAAAPLARMPGAAPGAVIASGRSSTRSTTPSTAASTGMSLPPADARAGAPRQTMTSSPDAGVDVVGRDQVARRERGLVDGVRPDHQQLRPLQARVAPRRPHLTDDAAQDHRARRSWPSTMPTTMSLSATSAPTVRSRTRLPCATSTRSPGPAARPSTATTSRSATPRRSRSRAGPAAACDRRGPPPAASPRAAPRPGPRSSLARRASPLLGSWRAPTSPLPPTSSHSRSSRASRPSWPRPPPRAWRRAALRRGPAPRCRRPSPPAWLLAPLPAPLRRLQHVEQPAVRELAQLGDVVLVLGALQLFGRRRDQLVVPAGLLGARRDARTAGPAWCSTRRAAACAARPCSRRRSLEDADDLVDQLVLAAELFFHPREWALLIASAAAAMGPRISFVA